MQIHTWYSEHAPSPQRWIARILLPGGYLPVNLVSSSEEGAIQCAQDFYESEKKRLGKAKPKSTPPKTRYWHHPESSSVYTTGPDGSDDPLSSELDKAEYDRLKAEYATAEDAGDSAIEDLLA